MGLEQYRNLTIVLDKIGKKVRDDYKVKLKTPDKRGFNAIATGKLFNSVGYKLTITDDNIKLLFTYPDQYYDIQNKDMFIEIGRKPNAGKVDIGKLPPINKIRGWIIAKKIPKTPNIEYKIQRSIYKKGIIARPYFKQVTKNIVKYNRELEKALTKDIKEYIDNKTKKEFQKVNTRI